MSYLLYLTASNQGIQSTSRGLAEAFLKSYSLAHPDVKIITRDLNSKPIPHLDEETILAGYVPVDQQSPEQKAKDQFRHGLIEEIKNAKDICIATPMWNWGIPSVLKAYIDHIVKIGALDPRDHRHLAGKSVTCIVACGGPYATNADENFANSYLKQVLGKLGATDIEGYCSEWTLAGKVPGMDALIPAKEKSYADILEALERRSKNI